MGSIEENVWQSMLLLHEQFCNPNRNTVDISRFHDLFLDMFLHAVEVMLKNIRAERDGD